MYWATYLVRVGNEQGVYSTIIGAEDSDKAVIWARYQAGKNGERLSNEAKHGRTLGAQETAFVAWCETACDPLKVIALASWHGALGDALPIFAPTGQAAWSLAQEKTVAGRVSRLEVSPASLKMVCPECGAEYSAYWPDYSFHGYADDYTFTCACDKRAPVMLFIAPNGEEVSDTATAAEMREWYHKNTI